MNMPGFSFDLGGLSRRPKADPDHVYDLLILGGGPASLTAAIYAARKLLDFAIISHEFGGKVKDTSEIENYLGYQTVSGRELSQKFIEHADKFSVPVGEGERVLRIRKSDMLFNVGTDHGNDYQAKTVIYATGKRHRLLHIPGEEKLMGKGISFCAICDAPFYQGKCVIVAGGGNAAFTAAHDLVKVATHVTLVNHSPGYKADPLLIETVNKYKNIILIDNHDVVRLNGDAHVESVDIRDKVTGEEKTIAVDGIFIQIGLNSNTEPLQGFAELNSKNELMIDSKCGTSVPGLFGAGDVTTVPYDQIIISAGEGAKAALSAYDYLVMNRLID